MDRKAVADLLRSRRDRLRPADVGLAPGVRRQTTGLRREEVAALAATSTDYYARLEQGRGPRPSVAVLGSLARALRMSDDERDHLFHLSGHPVPVRPVLGYVSAGMSSLLDTLTDTPAFVIDDLGTVLAQNRMSTLVSGDRSVDAGREANYVWRWFAMPDGQDSCPEPDRDRHSRSHVADLRATVGRRGDDADVRDFVRDLEAASPEFARLWTEYEVAVRSSLDKVMIHPEVGLLTFRYERLLGADGATLVVLHPTPGSGCRDKLRLLAVIGTQRLDPDHGLPDRGGAVRGSLANPNPLGPPA